jgi:hypothetical protein
VKDARRRDEVIARDRQRDVEGAQVRVELARAQIGERVPAAHVVEGDDRREPLGDLEDRPVGDAFVAEAVDALLRKRERPRDVETNGAGPRRKRRREFDARERVVDRKRKRGAVRLELKVLAPAAADRPVAPLLTEDGAPEAVVAKEVLFDVQPEKGERLRRAVAIGDRRAGRHATLLRVERRRDRIVGFLSPIRRPRRARRRTNVVRRRKIERAERDVGRVRRREGVGVVVDLHDRDVFGRDGDGAVVDGRRRVRGA